MSATEGGKSLDRGKTRVVVSRWGEMSEGRVCLRAGPAQYLSPVQGAGDPREPSIGQGEEVGTHNGSSLGRLHPPAVTAETEPGLPA